MFIICLQVLSPSISKLEQNSNLFKVFKISKNTRHDQQLRCSQLHHIDPLSLLKMTINKNIVGICSKWIQNFAKCSKTHPNANSHLQVLDIQTKLQFYTKLPMCLCSQSLLMSKIILHLQKSLHIQTKLQLPKKCQCPCVLNPCT